MSIGENVLVALGIAGLIGFIGCDQSDDEKGDALPGNWILVYDFEEDTYDGETDTWEETYDDIRYAMIAKFTDSTVASYFNEPCSDAWGTNSDIHSTYTLEEGNKMIITTIYNIGVGYPIYTSITEYDYSLSGNELTLSHTWTDSTGSGSSLRHFEKYSGTFPPSDWTTALSNDTYEPDNHVTSATSLTIGTAEQSHRLTINDVDWFTFSAVAGTFYRIATTGNVRTKLFLYNPSGGSDWFGVDSDDQNTLIWGRFSETGTYSLAVQAFDPENECGEYDISVAFGSNTAKATGLRKEKMTVRHGHFRR